MFRQGRKPYPVFRLLHVAMQIGPYLHPLTGLGASRSLDLYSMRMVSTPFHFLVDLARYCPRGMFTVFTQYAAIDYSIVTP